MRFSETTWTILILVFLGAATFSEPLFRYFMLDLRSVQVRDGYAGQNLSTTVDRSIHRSGPYTWSVSVINVQDPKHSVYTAERHVPFPYVVTGEGSTLVHGTLAWWMGGKEQLEAAASAGFGSGRWKLKSCHFAWRGLWYACTTSNTFTIQERPE